MRIKGNMRRTSVRTVDEIKRDMELIYGIYLTDDEVRDIYQTQFDCPGWPISECIEYVIGPLPPSIDEMEEYKRDFYNTLDLRYTMMGRNRKRSEKAIVANFYWEWKFDGVDTWTHIGNGEGEFQVVDEGGQFRLSMWNKYDDYVGQMLFDTESEAKTFAEKFYRLNIGEVF